MGGNTFKRQPVNLHEFDINTQHKISKIYEKTKN